MRYFDLYTSFPIKNSDKILINFSVGGRGFNREAPPYSYSLINKEGERL